jgi:hypothetical protein
MNLTFIHEIDGMDYFGEGAKEDDDSVTKLKAKPSGVTVKGKISLNQGDRAEWWAHSRRI